MRMMPASLLLTAALAVTSSLGAQNVALVAEHLYTMDAGSQGGPGMVLIRNGKIDEVRQGANLQPPQGFQVIRGAYVTPGLIDADTTTGISGAYNISADQDQDESTDPNTADVNVRDSLNPEDLLYQYVNTLRRDDSSGCPGTGEPHRWACRYLQDSRPSVSLPDSGSTDRPAQLGDGIQSGRDT